MSESTVCDTRKLVCLLKLSDCLVDVDEPDLFSFIENGKRAGNPQASANGFLPTLPAHP